MISLSPRLQFQTVHKAEAEWLSGHARGRELAVSLNYALAEMSNGNATRDELNGARIFIRTLLNLSEEETPVKTLPVKSLSEPGDVTLKPEEKK